MTESAKLIVQSQVSDGTPIYDSSGMLRAFSLDTENDLLTMSDVFIRELFQNILDLSDDLDTGVYNVAAKVEDVFLGPEFLPRISGALGGEGELERLRKYLSLHSKDGHETGLDRVFYGGRVHCTIVSDYTNGTSHSALGMHGSTDPGVFNTQSDGAKSVWERYVLATGYSEKFSSRSGGGHGLGKIANIMASLDHFVVVYSYTNEESDGGKGVHKCICMAVNEHAEPASERGRQIIEEFGHTTGSMYIALPHSTNGKNGGIRETRGELAKELASAFGIEPREEEDFGTSICIFNSPLKMADLRASYHKFFFPAHIDVQIEPVISFVQRSESGGHEKKSVRGINFENYPDLQRYIHAYQIASGKTEYQRDAGEELVKFRRTSDADALIGDTIGSMGFCLFDDFKEDDEYRNKLALVRKFLVVNYVDYRVRVSPVGNFASAYLPSDAYELHKALAAAEPPKHHTWDIDQDRLTNAQKAIVHSVNKKLGEAYRRFIHELRPHRSILEKGDRKLSRMMGSLLPVARGGKRKVEKKPSMLTVKLVSTTKSKSGSFNHYQVKFGVSLSKNFDADKYEFPIEIRVFPTFFPEGAVSNEKLPIRVEPDEHFVDKVAVVREIRSAEEVIEVLAETRTLAESLEVRCVAEIKQ